MRDFDVDVDVARRRREVNCAEDIARDLLIHSRRAKERIIFDGITQGITVNCVGDIKSDDQGSSLPN